MFNRLKFNKLVQAKKDLNLLNFRHYTDMNIDLAAQLYTL